MRRQKWFFPFLSPIKNSISFYGQQNTLLLIEIPEKSTTAKKCSLILSATADQNVIKIKEWSEEVIVIVAYRSTIRLAILFTAGGFLNQVTYTHTKYRIHYVQKYEQVRTLQKITEGGYLVGSFGLRQKILKNLLKPTSLWCELLYWQAQLLTEGLVDLLLLVWRETILWTFSKWDFTPFSTFEKLSSPRKTVLKNSSKKGFAKDLTRMYWKTNSEYHLPVTISSHWKLYEMVVNWKSLRIYNIKNNLIVIDKRKE